MPTDLDIPKLRREAEAALHKWAGDTYSYWAKRFNQDDWDEEGRHIANMDPPTSIAVFDRLERAEAALREIELKGKRINAALSTSEQNKDADLIVVEMVHFLRYAGEDELDA